MRAGLLTVSTATPVSSWVCRSTDPPGNAPSFSRTSSAWKPRLAEYRLLCLEREELSVGGSLVGGGAQCGGGLNSNIQINVYYTSYNLEWDHFYRIKVLRL